jgi:hypothetical protein
MAVAATKAAKVVRITRVSLFAAVGFSEWE